MPTVSDLAQYIYSQAPSYGVDPNLALGIALREGLNTNTVTNGGNPDAGGYSYGPFQLYSGGLAQQFQQQTGLNPADPNTQQAQVDWTLCYMQAHPSAIANGSTTWYSIRDNGGTGNLTNIGANYATANGLSSNASYGAVDPITGESDLTSDASSDVVAGANTNGIFNNLDNDIFDGGTSSGGIGSDAVAGGTAGAPDASSVDWSDLPDDAFDGSTAASSVAGGTSAISPSGMTGISSSGAVGTQGSVGSIGAGGIAVNLTDESQLPSSVSSAGTAAKAGLTTAGSDVQTAAGGLAGTLASVINSGETYTSRAFVMIALVVMGAIFVAFGLSMFGKRAGLNIPRLA